MADSEQLNIEVVTPSIGAVIHDYDLSQPLTSDQKHALEQALYKHHVLFFRNQNLTPEQQRDFALSFGPIHVHPIYTYAAPVPEEVDRSCPNQAGALPAALWKVPPPP